MPNRSRGAQPAKPQRLTTTQRHLGWDHQTDRANLMRRHPNGKRCWWCGQPMYNDANAHKNFDGRKLHADHSKTRARYGGRYRADRLLHDTCNRQRGDGSRDDQRPALLAQQQQQPTPDDPNNLGPLALPWPWKTPE